MNLHRLYLTQNNCYKAGVTIKPKGVMVHDTAAGNPNLKRYVGPDDGLLGYNANNNHWNQPSPGGNEVCVHAFIGKLADGGIATYQTLPWTMRGWHGYKGPSGSVNDTHIGFEICDDGYKDAAYFAAVYQEAVEFTAYLCREYGFDPLADGVIIGHYEGYQRGIASNHGDPRPWFTKFGKSMDSFRRDVAVIMKGVYIMGKYVDRDKLVAWIDSNAIEVNQTGKTDPVTPPPAVTPPAGIKVNDQVRLTADTRVCGDSAGNNPGKTFTPSDGPFKVTQYAAGRSHGVHLDGLGWVPESVCKKV